MKNTGVGMTKLVEATNGYFLVEAENDVWYSFIHFGPKPFHNLTSPKIFLHQRIFQHFHFI